MFLNYNNASSAVDSNNKKLKVAVSVSVASFLGFLGFVICFILGRRRKDRGKQFLYCLIDLSFVHGSYIFLFVVSKSYEQ